MADKLIIEIDGNATGLTKALSNAESRLNTFNSKVAGSNKALGQFENKLGTSASALTRLSGSAKTLDTNLKTLMRGFASLAGSLDRVVKASAGASAALNSVNKSAAASSTALNRLGSSTKNVSDLMTSMGRRMAALNATISSMNTGLRASSRNMQAHGGAVSGVTNIINNYSRAANGSGGASNNMVRGMGRMNTASLSLAENFRRSVAQITALRTITYQGLFWFAPLIYSIVKVNSAYEKQMVLLKNISKETTETGKKQEAAMSRSFIVDKARTSPFAMNEITNAFVKMKVGGIDPMNGSLSTLLDSIAAFGGGSAELNRAAVAIQQMGGKGVISMEELRQQLGEHIPDAASAMAQGLGMTMGELFKTIETGTLESSTALAAMFEVLKSRHAGSAAEMMNTWGGVVARLQTTWQEFLLNVTAKDGNNSFMNTLKDQAEKLIAFMNTADGTKLMRDIQEALSITLKAFSSLVSFVVEYRDIIISVATIFATLWGGSLVLGTIARIVTAYGGLNSRLLSMIGVQATALRGSNELRAAMATLAAKVVGADRAASMFGMSTSRLNVAMRAFNASGTSAIGVIGKLAMGAIASYGAFALMAAGVMLAVYAVQALSEARDREARKAKSREIAAEGGSFKDEADRDRMLATQRDLEAKVAAGGEWVGGGNGRVWRQYTPQELKGIKAGLAEERGKIAPLEANWQRDKQERVTGNRSSNFNRTLDRNVNTARKPFDTQIAAIESKMGANDKPTPELLNLRRQAAQAEQAQLRTELAAVNREAGRNPADQFWQERQKELSQKLQGAEAGEGAVGSPTYTDGGKKAGGAGKKKGGGSKTDPLAGKRNTLSNEIMQSMELENELKNLRDGTDTRFDRDEAQAIADTGAAAGKTAEQIKALKNAEYSRQDELKKSIQVERAIIDLQDENAETRGQLSLQTERLKANYITIGSEVNEFESNLRREHRAELAIVEARIKANIATKEQIEQYRRLHMAIAEATRLKKAELAVEAANKAKEASREYRRSWQSDEKNRAEDRADELRVINDAINTIETDPEDFDKRRNEINTQYEEARQKLDDAIAARDANRNAQTEEAVAVANQEIVVTAELKQHYEEVNAAMQAGLPVLRERAGQIEREEAARKKWGGMGGPMIDWAKNAQKGIDDLGTSMGSLLTDGIDGLVDGLANGKLAFGDFVKSMLAGLLKIIIRALIAKAILSALGMGGGGSGSISIDGSGGGVGTVGDIGISGSTGPIAGLHTGGIVGQNKTFTRSVDAGLFSFAQRYHTGGIVGLGPNEVPIIAERGERVLTEEQQRAMNVKEPTGPNVQVNVINQTGTDAKVEREKSKFDGEKWVENIILKKISTPGPVRDSIGSIKKQ